MLSSIIRFMEDNSIKKFECENCLELVYITRYYSDKQQCGHMCDNCWQKFHIRMKQILQQ